MHRLHGALRGILTFALQTRKTYHLEIEVYSKGEEGGGGRGRKGVDGGRKEGRGERREKMREERGQERRGEKEADSD